MSEPRTGAAKATGVVVALVAVAAALGIEVDGEQAEGAKNAAAALVGAGGVLFAFGRDLMNKVRGLFS